MTGRTESLGTVLAPSGALLLVDMGILRYWSHDRVPDDAGDDGDVPHRERALAMLERGGGEVEFQAHRAVVIPGLPTGRALPVQGEWMPDDHPHAGRFRRVTIECQPEASVARSELLGHALVTEARLGFFDLNDLGQWCHDECIDGQADVAFWGRDEDEVAQRMEAPQLDPDADDPVFGWSNLPEDEAIDRLIQLEALQASGLMFAHDYRPHSHHYLLCEQMRPSPTQSGTLTLGTSTVCAFFTTWGDGSYELHRELDSKDQLVRLRIELGDDRRVEQLDRILAGRALPDAEAVSVSLREDVMKHAGEGQGRQ